MHFIYDNLTATIIALTTTLLLLNIQSQATQSNVAQTARNMAKHRAQTFASWLEKDLGRLGANIDQDERIPFDSPETTQMEGGTRLTEQFTYYRDRTEEDNGETRIATRYQVEKVTDKPRDLYQLTRTTKEGAGSWSDKNGSSSPTLGYFQIDMLDRDADLVSSPKSNFDQVETIRVRYSIVPPFENKETILQATHVGSFLLVRSDDNEFDPPGDGDDDDDEDGDDDGGDDDDGDDDDGDDDDEDDDDDDDDGDDDDDDDDDDDGPPWKDDDWWPPWKWF